MHNNREDFLVIVLKQVFFIKQGAQPCCILYSKIKQRLFFYILYTIVGSDEFQHINLVILPMPFSLLEYAE